MKFMAEALKGAGIITIGGATPVGMALGASAWRERHLCSRIRVPQVLRAERTLVNGEPERADAWIGRARRGPTVRVELMARRGGHYAADEGET
jgi:hypothetical protein